MRSKTVLDIYAEIDDAEQAERVIFTSICTDSLDKKSQPLSVLDMYAENQWYMQELAREQESEKQRLAREQEVEKQRQQNFVRDCETDSTIYIDGVPVTGKWSLGRDHHYRTVIIFGDVLTYILDPRYKYDLGADRIYRTVGDTTTVYLPDRTECSKLCDLCSMYDLVGIHEYLEPIVARQAAQEKIEAAARKLLEQKGFWGRLFS